MYNIFSNYSVGTMYIEKAIQVFQGQDFLIFDSDNPSFHPGVLDNEDEEDKLETLEATVKLRLKGRGFPLLRFKLLADSLNHVTRGRELLRVEAVTPENINDGYVQTEEDGDKLLREIKMGRVSDRAGRFVDPAYTLVFRATCQDFGSLEDWQIDYLLRTRLTIKDQVGGVWQSRVLRDGQRLNFSRVYNPNLGTLAMPRAPFVFQDRNFSDSLLMALREKSKYNKTLIGCFNIVDEEKEPPKISNVFLNAFPKGSF